MPDFHTKRHQLGTVLSEAVLGALKANTITLNDAYDLTGLTSKSFDAYYRRR